MKFDFADVFFNGLSYRLQSKTVFQKKKKKKIKKKKKKKSLIAQLLMYFPPKSPLLLDRKAR